MELVPHLAVTLGRPDDRSFDPVQLVPEAGDVEGERVLEDRPAAVLVDERGMGGVEGVLERAAPAVDLRDWPMSTSRKCRVWATAASTASRPRATAPRPPTSASARNDAGIEVWVAQSRWKASPV